MRRIGILLAAILATSLVAGCVHRANLDRMEKTAFLSGDESALDEAALTKRVTALFAVLREDKITTFNTREKLRPFFRTEKDLADFLAIYAAEFRSLQFRRDKLAGFKIRDVRIEENGVIGLVRIDLRGWLWLFLPSRLKEVEEWQKSEGEWYLTPTAR
jgi:hypothetical protein